MVKVGYPKSSDQIRPLSYVGGLTPMLKGVVDVMILEAFPPGPAASSEPVPRSVIYHQIPANRLASTV